MKRRKFLNQIAYYREGQQTQIRLWNISSGKEQLQQLDLAGHTFPHHGSRPRCTG